MFADQAAEDLHDCTGKLVRLHIQDRLDRGRRLRKLGLRREAIELLDSAPKRFRNYQINSFVEAIREELAADGA